MSGRAPQIAYYGDDFTGATDALATAAGAGLRSLLFLGAPTAEQLRRAGPLDCLGIAGAARSMAPAAMREALAPVAALFAALQPRVLHYKTCSTFDSATDVGNIAVAIDVLHAAVPAAAVAVIGGQPSLRRYCVFGELFAAAGDEVFRIDRHPTMSRHPVTPMAEADLRVHFAQLGLADLRSIAYPAYAEGAAGVRERWHALRRAGAPAVLFDVATTSDLAVIGAVLAGEPPDGPLLAVGASSVIEAFATQWGNPGAPRDDGIGAAPGPVLVLAGSLSPVTARQVARATAYRTLRLDASRLAAGDAGYRDATVTRIASHLGAGEHVLACTVDAAGNARTDIPARALAVAGGDVLARVLAACPVRRFGVAGGDTSSLAMSALDAWGLSHLSRIAPGVALCRIHSDRAALDGVEVMLKGGQMGPDDLFDAFARGDHARAARATAT